MISDADNSTGHTAELIFFSGGEFVMGSDHHYPEERPARTASVAPFAIDRHAVTNAQFARFVEATGYITTAESTASEQDKPGSLVFQMTDAPVSLLDPRQWWTHVPGAYWHAPEGPGSSIDERMDHPVVQVSKVDAAAYADWAGKRLPTEREWEFAASFAFDMRTVLETANIWRGHFPHRNDRRDTPPFTVTVKSKNRHPKLPEHMIGNVWEWTSTPFHKQVRATCCGGSNSKATSTLWSLKGGSFLCADTYCRRYRPQARIGQIAEHSTNHIGFRCAVDSFSSSIFDH